MNNNEVRVTTWSPEPSEVIETRDEKEGPFYWTLLKHDRAGLYFRYPDIAKGHALNDIGKEYRDMLELLHVSCLTGQERSLLKIKKSK